ncbi:hypothetical protein [Sphingomonas aracearum]|uniref:hypothetical protein n=1 Tax=Sphingomonas aracearum TaxID=2283317 RepID=UPI0011C01A82|nr:hypothetical protein [Sphingomonas aracearum]
MLPWAGNLRADHALAERRAQLQALPKVRLPAAYPRHLVIAGDLSPDPPEWFLAASYVDTLDLADDRSEHGGFRRWVPAGDAAACRAAALARSDPRGAATPVDVPARALPKLSDCAREAGDANNGGDAVILRLGDRTTLFDRETARRTGAPRLLPEARAYPCVAFATLQIVANHLDAARRPAQAAELMRRGSTRRGRYDPCIRSEAPTLPG